MRTPQDALQELPLLCALPQPFAIKDLPERGRRYTLCPGRHPGRLTMDTTVREKIISYLLGETTLSDLEEWLTLSTWEIEAADADSEVAFDAQILLAEHARGDRNDDDLARALRRLIAMARIGNPPPVATTANAVTERATGWTQPRIVGAGRRSAAALS